MQSPMQKNAKMSAELPSSWFAFQLEAASTIVRYTPSSPRPLQSPSRAASIPTKQRSGTTTDVQSLRPV